MVFVLYLAGMFVAVGLIGLVAWLLDPMRRKLAAVKMPGRGPVWPPQHSLMPSSMTVWCVFIGAIVVAFGIVCLTTSGLTWFAHALIAAILLLTLVINSINHDREALGPLYSEYRKAFAEASSEEEPKGWRMPFVAGYVFEFVCYAVLTAAVLHAALRPGLGIVTRLGAEALGILALGSLMVAFAQRVKNPSLDIRAYRRALVEAKPRMRKIGA